MKESPKFKKEQFPTGFELGKETRYNPSNPPNVGGRKGLPTFDTGQRFGKVGGTDTSAKMNPKKRSGKPMPTYKSQKLGDTLQADGERYNPVKKKPV